MTPMSVVTALLIGTLSQPLPVMNQMPPGPPMGVPHGAPGAHRGPPGAMQSGGGQGPHRALREHLFPPELLMHHQSEIGLTESQREELQEQLKAMQVQMVELQFEIERHSEKLGDLLAAARPNEAQVLAQVGKVMEVEREIKLNHLRLLIRIKNMLSPEQQQKLQELKQRR